MERDHPPKPRRGPKPRQVQNRHTAQAEPDAIHRRGRGNLGLLEHRLVRCLYPPRVFRSIRAERAEERVALGFIEHARPGAKRIQRERREAHPGECVAAGVHENLLRADRRVRDEHAG